MSGDYTDAAKDARQEALAKIKQTDKQIAKIYENAITDITAKANAAKEGSLTQRWALDMQASLKASIKRLNGEMESTITDAATSAANLPGNVAGDWMSSVYTSAGGNLSGETFRNMFTSTNDEALRMVLSGRAYLDGKSLSSRIWTQTGRLESGINQVIQQGIAQKKSAVEIAKELEQYVNPDARETLAERRARLSGNKDQSQLAPLAFPGNTEYNCLRLARTSINHAFFLSMKNSAKLNPFCSCIHWELSGQHFTRQVAPFGVDICDDYATHDEGLGVGNWPIDGTPLPHANCLCGQWPEVPMSLDECAKRLRGWLDGGTDDELDSAFGDWKDALESGLPNRRLNSIRDDAGETRKKLLTQIAGRSDVQAMSVSKRQRMLDELNNASESQLQSIAKNGIISEGNTATDAETIAKQLAASDTEAAAKQLAASDAEAAAKQLTTSDAEAAAKQLIASAVKKINPEKQNRHLKDSDGYVEGRSYLYGTLEDAQRLVDEYSGTGVAIISKSSGEWKHKEVVTCSKEIGVKVNPQSGMESPTKRATIHYSKTGTHVVPTSEEE